MVAFEARPLVSRHISESKLVKSRLKEHFRIIVSRNISQGTFVSRNISESKLVKSRFMTGFLSCISAVFVLISKKISKWSDKSLISIPEITLSKSKVV